MNARAIPDNGIVVTEIEVLESWLDYNDHMNVAYYVAAFDLGIDAFKATLGVDLDYIAREKRSTVALEAHITYQREASKGERLRVETRLIDFDGKRSHLYQEMYRDEDLLATQETVSISFDTEARRTCLFAPEVAANYERMLAAQSSTPRPSWVGRSCQMGKGKPKAGD
jgi:acyl-CoA thioester hydrolase